VLPEPSGEVYVHLHISSARHRVNPANPDFADLVAALQQAQADGAVVWVTEDEPHHEIIDVRRCPHNSLMEAPVDEPPRVVRAVTLARANELFQMVAGQTCDPTSPSAACIPFLFPDNGCWGRASEVCRLFIAAGEQPAKLWIYGDMTVQTANNPECAVPWIWHVAATLDVQTATGTETMVIDPSLCAEPVSVAAWAAIVGNPSVPVPTAATVFMRPPSGPIELDPNFAKTARVLTTFRLQLLTRSISSVGPPPYVECLLAQTATAQ
jgi:hypothetical protein